MVSGPVFRADLRVAVRRRAAALPTCLLLATFVPAASALAAAASEPQWASLSAPAFELLSASPAHRRHLGLEGAWQLTQARRAPMGLLSAPWPGHGAAGARAWIAETGPGASPPSPIDDSRWAEGYALPGLSSVVHALVEYDGTLVAGGEFSFAGRQKVAHVARWAGGRWQPIGDGFDGPVYALTDYDGRLIAGGEFTRSGDAVTGPVAQWDGERWVALGAAGSGCVHALHPFGESLAVGGCFSISGVFNAGLWDGQGWTPLGSGMDGEVFAFTTFRNQLIAGGEFTTADGVPANRIARWSGTTWEPLGDGISGDNYPVVKTLLGHGDALIAGGWFSSAGGTAAASLARWDGHTWAPVPDAPLGQFEILLADGDSFFAAGFLHGTRGDMISLVRWSGGTWQVLGEQLWGVRSLVRHQGTLFIGGYFQWGWSDQSLSYTTLPWVGRLESNAWVALESPGGGMSGLMGGGASVMRVFKGQLIVGGQFFDAAGPSGWTSAQGVARWSSGGWEPLGATRGEVQTAVEYQGDLVFGGNFVAYQDGWASGVVRWDGTHWTSMNANGSIVRSLAIYRGDLYMSGARVVSGGQLQEGVFRWNGGTWEPAGAPFEWVPFETWVSTLHVHGDLLLAAGRFRGVTGLDSPNLVAWNGSKWASMGTPCDYEIDALATFQGQLYAGGAGTHGLAWTDGGDWHPIDIGVCAGVSAMGVVGDRLYAGGLFQSVDGVAASNIALWDGSSWGPLGSGTDGPVRGIGTDDQYLYVGGWFTGAGGKASVGIARWSLETNPVVTPPSPVAKASFHIGVGPNPARGEAIISYGLPEPGEASMTVHDVSGRVVANLLVGSQVAGDHEWTWHPAPGGLPAGVYVVRLASRGRVAITKLAWMP